MKAGNGKIIDYRISRLEMEQSVMFRKFGKVLCPDRNPPLSVWSEAKLINDKTNPDRAAIWKGNSQLYKYSTWP